MENPRVIPGLGGSEKIYRLISLLAKGRNFSHSTSAVDSTMELPVIIRNSEIPTARVLLRRIVDTAKARVT